MYRPLLREGVREAEGYRDREMERVKERCSERKRWSEEEGDHDGVRWRKKEIGPTTE